MPKATINHDVEERFADIGRHPPAGGFPPGETAGNRPAAMSRGVGRPQKYNNASTAPPP